MKKAIAIALIFILAIGFGFGITAGLVYGICWGFGLGFTWKKVVSVYLVMVLLKVVSHKGKKEDLKES